MKNYMWVLLIAIVLIAITFFSKNIISLDSDLGWHIRMGEYILNNGIPTVDPLSYTMPSFPFVDHEWLSNVIIFLLYTRSFLALCVLFALFIVAAIVIHLRKKQNVLFTTGVILLTAGSLLEFSGIRVQVLSWAFVSVLLNMIFDNKLWVRFRFLLPLLIFLWANLHGSFAVALFILGAFIVARFKEKKLVFMDVLVVVLSFMVTFLNPYGERLWGEVLFQAADSGLRWKIAEWVPGLAFLNLPYLTLLAISLVLIFKYRTQIPLLQICIFIALALLAVSSVRHVPFLIIAIVAIVPTVFSLFTKTLVEAEQKDRLKKTLIFFVFFASCTFLYQAYSNVINNQFIESKFYPSKKALTVLKNTRNGQIFAEYGWGGYLNWKLPNKKVFIDGRMPSWRWKAPTGESDNAFEEFLQIYYGKNYKRYFEKYNIKYVLLPARLEERSTVLKISNAIFSFKKGTTLSEKLKRDGWRMIFSDYSAQIYAK